MVQSCTPPDRSLTQRLDALERANEVRTERAFLKSNIRAGRVTIHDVLLNPPKCILTMKLVDLLLEVPKYGQVKTNKVMTQCGVSTRKTIGGLSERQLEEVLSILR